MTEKTFPIFPIVIIARTGSHYAVIDDDDPLPNVIAAAT